MRSTVTREELHIEPAEVTCSSVSDALLDASHRRYSRHVLVGGIPREDTGHAGVTMSPGWFGNALGSPGRAGEIVQGERSLGVPAETAALATWSQISSGGWMEMDGYLIAYFWLWNLRILGFVWVTFWSWLELNYELWGLFALWYRSPEVFISVKCSLNSVNFC